MSKLLDVAQGIMDSAAREYLEDNLENYQSVKDYAENGMGIYLTKYEAELIRLVCLRMNERIHNGDIPSTDEWYYDFERILLEESEIQKGL